MHQNFVEITDKRLLDVFTIEKMKKTELLLNNKKITVDSLHEFGLSQFCFTSPNKHTDPNDFMLGLGSMKTKKFKTRDFVWFIDHYKDTVYHDIYETVPKIFENPIKIGRMRVMLLYPKYCLTWHKDSCIRLHIPLETNPGCLIVIESEARHLSEGIPCLCNTTKMHTAVNASQHNRYHLVMDIIEQ